MHRTSWAIGVTNTANQRLSSQSAYPVLCVDGKTIYKFAISAINTDLHYTKSTDGGRSWEQPVSVFVGTCEGFSVWYDRWTPGSSGDLIHFAYIEGGAVDDVLYRNLNTTNDSLGTQTTIMAATSTVAGIGQCISITRTRGGNLLVAVDIDGGTENQVSRSVDVGANWTTRTDAHEAGTGDFYLFAPGFAADNQDAMLIFWDRSADEISRKIYDDSANTWAETSIATSMVESSTFVPNFAIAIDPTNNKILLVAWSAVDTANADLRYWTIDESAITEGTNVVQNSTDDQGMCGISLDPVTGWITVYYGGKSDGSETFQTAIHIYYKVSRDGGTTWGPETRLTEINRAYSWLIGCPILYWGGRPLAVVEASQTPYLLSIEPNAIHPLSKSSGY
jgi:hypothetical protein